MHCYLLRDYLFLIYFNCIRWRLAEDQHTNGKRKKSRMMCIYSRRVYTCVGVYILSTRFYSFIDIVLGFPLIYVAQETNEKHMLSKNGIENFIVQ